MTLIYWVTIQVTFLFYLVRLFIAIVEMFSGNILVIIQRSNGDVFLSSSLIVQLQQNFNPDAIDLLVNDDTLEIAKTLPNIRQIYTFSYQK